MATRVITKAEAEALGIPSDILVIGPVPVRRQRPFDVQVENHGSIVLVRPLTDAARQWLTDNVPDSALWFNDALVVEPRYVDRLVEGMIGDGLNPEAC